MKRFFRHDGKQRWDQGSIPKHCANKILAFPEDFVVRFELLNICNIFEDASKASHTIANTDVIAKLGHIYFWTHHK